MFSSSDLSLAAGKMRKINLSQAASGIIFSVQIAALGSLMRVTGRIFKMSTGK
jgi:hypothetical protein